MESMFMVLAHGALGYWDEVILFLIVAIFLGFTVVSWFKNRQASPETLDSSLEQSPSPSADQPSTDNKPVDKDRFELD